LAFITGLLAGLACAHAGAQGYKPFPGVVVDQRTKSIQERVEAIYSAGDYERALLIYEKELAPIGDKYAQYMVGYMHLHAEGVEQDNAEALAWFRLAAERGTTLLEQVRDEMMERATPAEIARSDEIFLDLWKKMGDRVLLLALIQRDMDRLREQTGTRIPGASRSNPTMIIRPTGEPAGPAYYDDIRARLRARIEYLDARVEIDDAVIAEEIERVRESERQVREDLSAMDNL
jgi:hypothetical protein